MVNKIINKFDNTLSLDELLEAVKGTNLPDPIMYQYYLGLKNRQIIINEQITAGVVEMVILPLLQMDNDGSGKPIEIILNTVGGSLFDGFALVDIIDHLKCPTTITVITYAYSMGSIILCAGYNNPNVKKRCYKHSTALLHSGSTFLDGQTTSVKDQFNFHQKYEQMIKDYILNNSKISEEEYDKMERYEWYMTSDAMLEKGLVDEVL